MRTVDIGTVIGQVHIVPARKRQYIVNHRSDPLTKINAESDTLALHLDLSDIVFASSASSAS